MKLEDIWKAFMLVLIAFLLIIAAKNAWEAQWMDMLASMVGALGMLLFWPNRNESHNAAPEQHETATPAENGNETDS